MLPNVAGFTSYATPHVAVGLRACGPVTKERQIPGIRPAPRLARSGMAIPLELAQGKGGIFQMPVDMDDAIGLAISSHLTTCCSSAFAGPSQAHGHPYKGPPPANGYTPP